MPSLQGFDLLEVFREGATRGLESATCCLVGGLKIIDVRTAYFESCDGQLAGVVEALQSPSGSLEVSRQAIYLNPAQLSLHFI